MRTLAYTNATLVQAYRFAKANGTNCAFQVDWCTRLNGEEWIKWFRGCLNEKINRDDKRTGRKFSSDYFWTMKRAARELNSNTCIHWLPKELKDRFAHRIFTEE